MKALLVLGALAACSNGRSSEATLAPSPTSFAVSHPWFADTWAGIAISFRTANAGDLELVPAPLGQWAVTGAACDATVDGAALYVGEARPDGEGVMFVGTGPTGLEGAISLTRSGADELRGTYRLVDWSISTVIDDGSVVLWRDGRRP